MKINILAFGIAKDIVNNTAFELEVADQTSVADLKAQLCTIYPAFEQLRTLAIAVNTAYQTDDYIINANDEVVIIPPVSGG